MKLTVTIFDDNDKTKIQTSGKYWISRPKLRLNKAYRCRYVPSLHGAYLLKANTSDSHKNTVNTCILIARAQTHTHTYYISATEFYLQTFSIIKKNIADL